MSTTQANSDPFKRYATGHRGVVYRIRSDGSRTYYVYATGRFTRVEGGEEEARARRAERAGKATHLFSALAGEWFASKRKLRRSTRERYRGSLDLWLLPKLGHLDLTEVTTDRIAAMIAEMEVSGLSASSVLNNLKPLSGTLKLAMQRGLIARDPVTLLTSDERPRLERREMRILEPAEIDAPLAASRRRVVLAPSLARQLTQRRQTALTRGHSRPDSFVFNSATPTPASPNASTSTNSTARRPTNGYDTPRSRRC